MKKIFLFLTSIVLLSAFTACNHIDTECELVDYAEKCEIVRDKYIRVEKDSTDVTYIVPNTEDLANPSWMFQRILVEDTTGVYVYRCDDQYAISKVNLEDARAIRDMLKETEFSDTKTATNSLIVGIIVLILVVIFVNVSGDGKVICFLIPLAIIMTVSTNYERSEYVGKGTISNVENNIVYYNNPHGILHYSKDICTKEPLCEGQNVHVYKFRDTFFASEKLINEETLKYGENVPSTWWIYSFTYILCFIAFLFVIDKYCTDKGPKKKKHTYVHADM